MKIGAQFDCVCAEAFGTLLETFADGGQPSRKIHDNITQMIMDGNKNTAMIAAFWRSSASRSALDLPAISILSPLRKPGPRNHHQGWVPGRPACDLPIGLRGAQGATLGSLSVGPLLSGAATSCRARRSHVTRDNTTVRYSQRTSLRLLSRMRATTFMHVVVPPPDKPAPAGPAA